MIKPKLTKEQVKKAMEMACERCSHFEECDQDGNYGADYQCEFGKYYSRILQEFS